MTARFLKWKVLEYKQLQARLTKSGAEVEIIYIPVLRSKLYYSGLELFSGTICHNYAQQNSLKGQLVTFFTCHFHCCFNKCAGIKFEY